MGMLLEDCRYLNKEHHRLHLASWIYPTFTRYLNASPFVLRPAY